MHVIAMAVLSLDGCLTRHDEDGVSFASREDQEQFRTVLREVGVSVMGRRTFEVERERILKRVRHAPDAEGSESREDLRIVLTREPERYANLAVPGRLEFTSRTPGQILEDLAGRGWESVLVLGGTQVYDLFTEGGLITEWRITVEPLLLGDGARLLGSPVEEGLTLVERRLLNASTLLLRYRPR